MAIIQLFCIFIALEGEHSYCTVLMFGNKAFLVCVVPRPMFRALKKLLNSLVRTGMSTLGMTVVRPKAFTSGQLNCSYCSSLLGFCPPPHSPTPGLFWDSRILWSSRYNLHISLLKLTSSLFSWYRWRCSHLSENNRILAQAWWCSECILECSDSLES